MTLTIYSISDLTKPRDFRWYNSVDYCFFENILKKKFPGSRICIEDDIKTIAQTINNIIEDRGEERAKHTGIYGIILPARHADYEDVYDMVCNITIPSFSNEVKKIKTEFDKKRSDRLGFGCNRSIDEFASQYNIPLNELEKFVKKNFSSSTHFRELSLALGNLFYEKFNIPIFETWKFIPNYRIMNSQIGKYESKKEEMEYVKFAYKHWLDVNFNKDYDNNRLF